MNKIKIMSEQPTIVEREPMSISTIEKMLISQDKLGLPRTIIHTDIDNTFRMADATKDLATKKLFVTLENSSIPIHAVTGASFESVKQRIDKGELPYFAIISSKVGTERWILTEINGQKQYIRDTAWDEQMRGTGYDKKLVVTTLQNLINQPPETMMENQLVFQKSDEESKFLESGNTDQPFKTSCYFFAHNPQTVIQEVSKKFPNLKVVVCEEIGYNSKISPGEPKKWCLDVLPITKFDAVQDIAQRYQSQINITAGDSGNDKEMVLGENDVSIIVGGAKEELKQALEKTFGFTPLKSFSKGKEGRQRYYLEKSTERKGPESIIYTLRVLARFAKIYWDQLSQYYEIDEQKKSSQTEFLSNLLVNLKNV